MRMRYFGPQSNPDPNVSPTNLNLIWPYTMTPRLAVKFNLALPLGRDADAILREGDRPAGAAGGSETALTTTVQGRPAGAGDPQGRGAL